MDKDNFHVRIYNFFVGLAFVPFVLYKFIIAWLSTGWTVKKASKIFREKLLEIGFPDKITETLTKEYASAKDYIFEGFLKRKTKTQTSNTKKIGGLRDVFIKILPGGQIFLRIKTGHTKDLASAVFLDATKTIILIVGISRALDRDIYWVVVCIVSYVLYSLLFGFASELINKHQNSVKGLLGSVINVIGEALSDTKVVAIVGLALSSHSILGAPFVPLYHVIPNLDFIEHYISGFGIGLFAVKAYGTFISHISYSKALTILSSIESSNQILLFETSAELPFVCYSAVFVGLVWEGLEEIAEQFTPRVVNVFFWNGVADVFMALLGALTAYTLVSRSFIIKKRENCSNLEVKNAKVDPRAIKRASDTVLTHMKSAVDNVYSESSAKDFSKDVGTHKLTEIGEAVKRIKDLCMNSTDSAFH
ncbi:MAG: hypothetical protein OEY24_03020 [Candidatus Bathyarchaeota archaeon]|nr:hypothetical protein [Candidatus Bathyarchaeota archaeon]MDH5494659.1 hypothetical protein [Candidatus Bathyarchaeota archaeon]